MRVQAIATSRCRSRLLLSFLSLVSGVRLTNTFLQPQALSFPLPRPALRPCLHRPLMTTADTNLMSLPGTLFVYAEEEFARRVAFQHGEHKRHLVLVGGLSDGLFPVPYTAKLAHALNARGWSLVQVLLSSSYMGFGTCTLRNDVEELDALFYHLATARGSEAMAIMGHSTGCQDAVLFTKEGKNKSKLRFTILQAPVSDREHLGMQPDVDKYIGLAKDMVAAGNQDEIMPRATLFAPITARRFLDLATKEGLDDMFSSDLNPEELAGRLGHMDVPTLLLISGADEYVPPNINVQDLVDRMRAVIPAKTSAVTVEQARHSLKGHEDEAVRAVLAFMDELRL